MMQQAVRVHLGTRIKPELKAALPQLAEAQGIKNQSRLIEHLVEQELERQVGDSKQEDHP